MMAISNAFVWGKGGAQLTPEQIAKQREIEDALLQRGIDTSPVGSVYEGLARVANAAAGSFRRGRLDRAEAENNDFNAGKRAEIASIISGVPQPSATPSIPSPGAAAEVSATSPAQGGNYRDAIASIESAGSGDYNAVGPTHPKMGRAMGRYQIMEANIGPWSQAALGRAVTPDEFMADPKMQDAIFDHQFGQYVQKYGPEGAAQAWLGGEGGVGKTDRKDSLGTSIGTYGQKFMNALGPSTQIAQAAPATAPNGQAIPPAILEVFSDPRYDARTRGLAELLLKQTMGRQQAEQEMRIKQADPAYQLGLEKSRLEVENLRNPRLTASDRLSQEKFDWEKQNGGRTSDIKEYEYARERGYEGSFVDFQLAQKKAGAASTNVNVGEGDKFYENLDKKNAETFAAMSDSGMQARAKMGQIDRLEGLFANVPQGVEGGLKKIAGDWGVAIGEGTSDIQAASALLEKMVPEQRAPGSGPMSDADIKMFRSSLPRVLNQPGGNQLIFQTMRGIAQYEMEMGAIADQVADRTISPAEGRKLIRELKNPLAEYKIPEGPTPNEGRKTSTGVQWSIGD